MINYAVSVYMYACMYVHIYVYIYTYVCEKIDDLDDWFESFFLPNNLDGK